MSSKVKRTGIAVATAAVLSAGLVTTSAQTAHAGVGCATKVDNVPVRSAPRSSAKVVKWIPHAGSEFGCGSSSTSGWAVVSYNNGGTIGYGGWRFFTRGGG